MQRRRRVIDDSDCDDLAVKRSLMEGVTVFPVTRCLLELSAVLPLAAAIAKELVTLPQADDDREIAVQFPNTADLRSHLMVPVVQKLSAVLPLAAAAADEQVSLPHADDDRVAAVQYPHTADLRSYPMVPDPLVLNAALPLAAAAADQLVALVHADDDRTAAVQFPIAADESVAFPLAVGMEYMIPDLPLQMNSYFKQFPAYRHGRLQPPLQRPAPDAETLDLRSAIPPSTSRFIESECVHVPNDSDDSSGQTGSDDSDDGSSFIDDSPVPMTADDIAFIAHYAAKEMPIAQYMPRTSAMLMALPAVKRRYVVTSSSSSSVDDANGPPELLEDLSPADGNPASVQNSICDTLCPNLGSPSPSVEDVD
jgi:hypothetical protein